MAHDHYFGRNLDLEYGYCEQVTVTPRNFLFCFRHLPPIRRHYAMIGMATVIQGYPLYYEATNEMGLSMAGLNFPGLAHYEKCRSDKENVAVYELIPWVLSQCDTLAHAKDKLRKIRLVDTPFSQDFPPTPLHWLISDATGSITVEPMLDGLHIYDNPVGVMTNGPDFPYHLHHLKDYQSLSPLPPSNRFAPDVDLSPYSGAMGAIGLPGDWSSASRFVRACFVKLNSPALNTEKENVNQFFRILQSVSMPMGSIQIKPGLHDITRYSCCCHSPSGRYYYTTYLNSRITCVDMRKTDLESDTVTSYPLFENTDFKTQN